jgi:hypothetical protein
MNQSLFRWWLTRSLLCAVVFAASFYLPGVAAVSAVDSNSAYSAAGLMACEPEFDRYGQYDLGVQSSVAAHPSGLVVECHKAQWSEEIWYRIGELGVERISWGESRKLDDTGYWPAVAISKEGYVIVVHSDRAAKNMAQLFYKVGKVDPNGDENQPIAWLTGSKNWDRGFHSSIAINDNGVIVGVHETGHDSTGLYYRVGRLLNPAGGDYGIQWDSGPWGIHYDEGINPHIAINNNNEVVQVHQVPGESLLHYRRGVVNGGTIIFEPSRRYDNNAEQPAVALLDNGVVLEVHCLDGLFRRMGMLSRSNAEEIDWAEPVKLYDSSDMDYPALAAAKQTYNTYAVQTHHVRPPMVIWDSQLHFSTALLWDCEGATTK